jgi:hypothetical protein
MYDSAFYIKSVSGLDTRSPKEISKLMSGKYDINRGFGFIETEAFQTFLQTTLVYQIEITQRVFDPLSGHFQSEKQVVYEQASFEIHPATKILQSYAGGRRLQRILLSLSEIFSQNVIFDDVFADIPTILSELRKRKIDFKVVGFSINNFRPEVGVIGKLVANSSDSRAAQTIINAYKKDILEVRLEVRSENSSYWYLSANGRISIKAPDRDILLSESEMLRDLVMEKQNA